MKQASCKIGVLNVADPRLGPEWFGKIMEAGTALSDLLAKAGFDVVDAPNVIAGERDAQAEALRMRHAGCVGIVARIAWFHRSNVPVALAQHAELPLMICAFPNPNDTGFEGLALAHGALDEVGIGHGMHYGAPTPGGSRPVIAWAQACKVRHALRNAIYGEVGGRCLEMLPGSSDPNQLRKLFGFHIDPMEQWTLIRRAETIPESEWKPAIEQWGARYASMEATQSSLERSARLYVAGNRIFEERGWNFAGIQCQLEMIDNYLGPCLPIAQWNDDGFTVACETDINNALGMYVVQQALGRPGMFCDIFHLDTERGIFHALNCGTAAPSLAGGADRVNIREQTPLQGTWDEKKNCSLCQGGACSQFIMPPGPVTMLRFGRIDGEYVVHIEEGQAIEHPYNPDELGGITQTWPFAYVQLDRAGSIDRFIRNLRSHHAVLAPAACADMLRAFAGLTGVRILL